MSWFSLKGLEKLTYIVGVPGAALYGGWCIYKKEVVEAGNREQQVKRIENKFIEKHDNLLKLQNFNKKVFAIGLRDDEFIDPEIRKTDVFKRQVAANACLIRNFIKEVQAENVVLELCDERYGDEMSDVLAHPNYDRTLS